jgi:hypothetical protein
MISLALAAAFALGARGEHILPQFTVKQSGGGLGYWVEETAVFAGVYPSRQTRGEPRFWIVEQRRADRDIGKYAPGGVVLEFPGWTLQHQWIDSRQCPALADVIHKMRALAVPETVRAQIAPRLPKAIAPIPPSDTPVVSVAEGADPGPARATDYDERVSRWWWETERAIATCWQAATPTVNRRAVQPLITGQWVVR